MTIGIIGAMEQEIELLLANMEETEEVTVAHSRFITGKLHGQSVVLLQSGIGKVNAAMATTILHERFSPEIVINTGSAGGFASELEVGDVVISTDVTHHDVDATAFGYKFGQVPGMPVNYTADERLNRLARESVEETGINYASGLIATADSFMDDKERVDEALRKFPDMKAAEMEAAAIAQVCYQYGTPFVIIRALSDIAGKQSDVSFNEFLEKAATNAATIIMRFLTKL